MKKFKLLFLLFIFGSSFWLAGGNNLFNKNSTDIIINNTASIDNSLVVANSFY